MAMVLCNAPATFQTLMNSIVRDVIDKFFVMYLDDLLIFSESKEENIEHLRTILGRVKRNELYVFPKKCIFLKDEVEFFGLVAGCDRIRVDSEKVAVIN